MRISESSLLFKGIQDNLLNLPTPSAITVNWTYGSSLGICLGIQLLTGVFLALHCTGSGLLMLAPIISLFWSILILFNLSAPPTLSLLSELLMFSSWVSYTWVASLLIALLILMVLVYSLILFFSFSHNSPISIFPITANSIKESLLMIFMSSWFILGVFLLSWFN